MKDNTDFIQNFDNVNYKSLYNDYKLKILASEIKQLKKRVKFNLKNNIVNNYLY